MSETEFKNDRDRWSYEEATRDPIFLLQARELQVIDMPSDCEWDGEGGILRQEDDDQPERRFTVEEFWEHYGSDHMKEEWRTIGVWFSREEAEEYGRRTRYRYGLGHRVYCVCAEGTLATILKAAGEANGFKQQRQNE